MNVFVIFGQMLVLGAMMLTGYITYKKEWITEETSRNLSKIAVNILNPLLVINGVLGKNREVDYDKLIINLKLVALFFVILILFSYVILFLLRPSQKLKSVYQLMSIFCNLGFMGIPVVKSVFGNEAIIYIVFYILIYNFLLYTLGLHLSRKAGLEFEGKQMKKEQSLLKGLKKMINPGVIAGTVAIIIFVSGISFPDYINSFFDYMGNATVPVSMILIGTSIAQVKLTDMLKDIKMYLFILIRMILLPVAVILAMQGLKIDAVIFGVFIIELGMPVGSIITLMAKENGADSEYCTKGIVLSTIASLVTLPLVCAFL